MNRGLVCLNVVYDDKDMRYNQEQGKRLLEHCSQLAAATDVMTQTQVRIAANIANGIKHAFNEFQCSEIIIGMHMHPEISPKFWANSTKAFQWFEPSDYHGSYQATTQYDTPHPSGSAFESRV